jgi:S-adenosylmethionine hydrolase
MPSGPSPIITLTTDFGLADHYVAAMKGAVLRHCPGARLVDVTHGIARHDILGGSIMVERAIDVFEPGTIHLAVIDPGVGTDRRILVARIRNQLLICPDNGVITWAWRRQGPAQVHELTWRPAATSATFHGRDILAPVAGMLAAGRDLAAFTRVMDDPILLPIAPAAALNEGRIIHIDHFGNAMTNIPLDLLRQSPAAKVAIGGRMIGPIRTTYAQAPIGQPLALIGSSGMVEIAVREASAAQELDLRIGDAVELA